MNRLPDEIWTQILDYLDPEQLLQVQAVCKSLRKLARDASLWRSKCFERAPSAVRAFSNGDSLSELLNGLSLSPRTDESRDVHDAASAVRMSRRARAIAKWDNTDSTERLDWYSEYVGRHAPLQTEWIPSTKDNEIRSIALFDSAQKVLGAMEDGSIRIWDVATAQNGRRNLRQRAVAQSGLLFSNLCEASEATSSSVPVKQLNMGTAVDSTVVDDHSQKAYITTEELINEIDLTEMRIVSQQKYAWRITAVSQQAGEGLPLMIGTSFSLNMHDPRMPLQHQPDSKFDQVDDSPEDEHTVFLPNYAKSWWENRSRDARRGPRRVLPTTQPFPTIPQTRHRCVPEVYAQIQPGPQTILHRGANEILVAGRMPSILFYDKRTFPRLESVIHSGARLSSLALLDHPPSGATSSSADATLIAAGEYHGRGSLELYELPHTRPTDRQATYEEPEPEEEPSSSNEDNTLAAEISSNAPFSHKNRQSSSAAKLLSVATQGARIVFSDSEGGLKWVERDGRGLARRWNINNYQYTHEGGAIIGESAARKILTFPEDETDPAHSGDLAGMKRGDGDLLIWTGSDIGIVTNKVKWAGHDELVAAFEEKMSLDESLDGKARRSSVEDERRKEEEYAKTMRRALERQADERRFLARFGRMGGS